MSLMVVKFITLLTVSVLLLSCEKSASYEIEGSLRCVSATKAYMMEMTPQGVPIVVDSTDIRGGFFRFYGRVTYPTMRFIRVGTRPPFDVFVENSKIFLTGSITLPDEIEVKGSMAHDEFNTLTKEYKKLSNRRSRVLLHLANARKSNNRKEMIRLKKTYDTYPDSLVWLTKQYVLNNPSSVGAAYFVCQLTQSFDIKRLEEVITLFDASIAECPYVEYLNAEVALNKQLKKGMDAPMFHLPSFWGDPSVSLTDFEGDFLFIDFGASWCLGTEQRTEELKRIYSKYTDKNFEIMTVFLDEDEKMWREYVEGIGAVGWEMTCDRKYWASPITKYYRVQSIPYGVLVSPDGKIAMVDPTLKELDAYLQKNVERRIKRTKQGERK